MNREITYVLALFIVGTAVASERVITFKNYCSNPVWFGFAGGASTNRYYSGAQCNSNSDCFSGTTCVQTGAIKQCFWNNPVPSNGNYKLVYGQSNSVSIPISSEDYNIVWSGAIAGRTNCNANTNSCDTADCGAGPNGCKPSQGFNQPATQAEVTFQKKDNDYYDVEIINGVNIPVSMGPNNA